MSHYLTSTARHYISQSQALPYARAYLNGIQEIGSSDPLREVTVIFDKSKKPDNAERNPLNWPIAVLCPNRTTVQEESRIYQIFKEATFIKQPDDSFCKVAAFNIMDCLPSDEIFILPDFERNQTGPRAQE